MLLEAGSACVYEKNFQSDSEVENVNFDTFINFCAVMDEIWYYVVFHELFFFSLLSVTALRMYLCEFRAGIIASTNNSTI